MTVLQDQIEGRISRGISHSTTRWHVSDLDLDVGACDCTVVQDQIEGPISALGGIKCRAALDAVALLDLDLDLDVGACDGTTRPDRRPHIRPWRQKVSAYSTAVAPRLRLRLRRRLL